MKSWFKRSYERANGKYRNRKRFPTSHKRKLFLERLSDRALLDAAFAEGESGVPASRDLDPNHDGWVTPLDALKIINDLNANGARLITNGIPLAPDFNADMEAGRTELHMDVYLVGAWDPDCDSTSLGIGREPGSGTVEVLYGGVIAYRPQEGFTGMDSFVYTVVDSANAEASGTVTITVNGGGDQDAPVVNDQSLTTEEDTQLTFQVIAQNIVSSDVSTADGPDNGVLTKNQDGSYTYTPNVNFTGTDTFTIVGRNASGQEDTGIITITVGQGGGGGVNAPPVANDTSVTTDEDTPTDVDLHQLASDPNGDTLTFSVPSVVLNGVLSLSNGVVTVIPGVNFVGTIQFDYTVDDGHGATDTGTVSVTVGSGGGENNAPVVENANGKQFDVHAGETAFVIIIAGDPDGDVLTARILETWGPSKGTATVTRNDEGNFVVEYKANANFSGSDGFVVVVTDGRGGETLDRLMAIQAVEGEGESAVDAVFGGDLDDILSVN